jgi:hypothetical protein
MALPIQRSGFLELQGEILTSIYNFALTYEHDLSENRFRLW